jgi:hypothetical protein
LTWHQTKQDVPEVSPGNKIFQMNRFFFRAIIPIIFIVAIHTSAMAKHLRSADMLVERICGTLTFKITVIAYLKADSHPQIGLSSEIRFGDGQKQKIPLTFAILHPELGVNISVATYTTFHTYASPGTTTITYIEHDRSLGVLNIHAPGVNSDDVAYVSSVTINTDDRYGCNKYPYLSVVPLDHGCSGKIFYHNPGASDANGDSLSYEMSVPSEDENLPAPYFDPNDRSFYSDFENGNEAKNGRPIFKIDAITGLVTWDAPGESGQYNIAFKIIEWRKDEATGVYAKLSTTVRDMQIEIETCTNTRPKLIVPADLCVIAGSTIMKDIFGTDDENSDVKIEVFSDVLTLSEPATYSPNPPSFTSSVPPAKLSFKWNTTIDHVRQQPYQVVFKITDQPPDGPHLVTFATWSIRVVAPPPEFTATLDVVKHHGVLRWTKYKGNLKGTQVWRRVGESNLTLTDCQIGMPARTGFGLIAELPPSDTSFRDTNFGVGLAAGAQYCYRLVARVTDTKSKVSSGQCIGPVQRDAPIITHVTIDSTATEGSARVSWHSPFGINKQQFPEPYEYEIFRANGFIGEVGIDSVGYTRDTTLLDLSIPTNEKVFNYRIVVYSKPAFSNVFVAVDTSAVASSVWLSAISKTSAIQLQWQDSVPWSNVVDSRPYHLIYRANGTDPGPEDFTLIDSVNVAENGFNYIDAGSYNGDSIHKNRLYTYRIATIGTYGNTQIPLQKNFSQSVSLYPIPNIKACTPVAAVDITDCSTYPPAVNCSQKEFSNIIRWEVPVSDDCIIDISGYKVYASEQPEGKYVMIGSTPAQIFTDEGLPSPIRFYRVSSVDSFGHEGPMSDSVYSDSCPAFYLPNVFSPNADGCNDTFTSHFDELVSPVCQPAHPDKCPRFVKAVRLKVYNRWGREVYHYSSNKDLSIYIDWNGKDLNGDELPAGIYYYKAEVDFNAIDTNKRHKTIKDWVQLLR